MTAVWTWAARKGLFSGGRMQEKSAWMSSADRRRAARDAASCSQ
jgi:hypothetical protein